MRTVALIVAIVLGIAAAIGIRAYLKNQARQLQETHRLVQVAVAKTTIEAGEKLDRAKVGMTEVPANTLSADIITMQDVDRYVDRELTREVDRDTILRVGFFISRDLKAASDRLVEGKRAVTIAVDATSGVAGLVRPGDHVDIYATSGAATMQTWKVLGDVVVLAADDRMSDVPLGVGDYRQYRRGYSSLTLAVTPVETELLIYLKDNARLTFALRPLAEVGESEKPIVVDATNVQTLALQANKDRQDKLKPVPGGGLAPNRP